MYIGSLFKLKILSMEIINFTDKSGQIVKGYKLYGHPQDFYSPPFACFIPSDYPDPKLKEGQEIYISFIPKGKILKFLAAFSDAEGKNRII